MEWNNEKVLSLLESYQGFPILWNCRNPRYKDRNARKDAYQQLALEFNCSAYEVEIKINKLRGQFQRESVKIRKSKRSGNGTDDVYIPKWFAYRLMSSFMGDESASSTLSNLCAPHILEPVIIKEINDEAEITTDAHNDFDTEREEVHKRKPEEHLEFSLPKRPCVQTKDQEDANDLDPAEKNKLRDDCRIFGEHVANKLSTYDSRIQAIVQHQINNILFEADMGRYSHSVPEQWSASPASSPSPQEVEAVLASSPAPHSRQETSSDLQLVLPHSSSSQPYLELVKEEEGVMEQHLPHSESLEEEMIPELGSPHGSTSHHLDTNTELHGTDNSICNESYNKAVESHIRTIGDTVSKLTGNRPSQHKEDEFDIFGRSVAIQLRTLPFAIALETQLKLQSILTEMRLKTNYCQSESLTNGIPTIVAPT